MRFRAKTLVGLEVYLNEVAYFHNGFDFDAFKKMVDSEMNNTNIAKAFGVDYRTVKQWRKVYENDTRDSGTTRT